MRRCTAALSLVVLASACVDHGFDVPLTAAGGETRLMSRVEVERAADILFVIDNSGSMAEEQDNLARNASSSADPLSLCNAQGFNRLRQYVDENAQLGPAQWPPDHQATYAECGFIERLMLLDNKFHIGVISTDMHDCDSPYSAAGRGSVPQRGCLQTAPDAPALTVLTPETPDLAARFGGIVRNLGVWGSALEKGMQAAQHFLTPDHDTPAAGTCMLARDCSDDRALFWRRDEVNACGDRVETKLVVIYVTDEDDCSNDGTIDEAQSGSSILCYSRPELLTPVAEHARFLTRLKTRPELVRVAAIAGFSDAGNGLEAMGCRLDEGVHSNVCDPAQGNSVATCDICINGEPVCSCHPAIPAERCQGVEQPATHCCQADPARRYQALAEAMPLSVRDTLCSDSYRDTMMEIADLANRTDVVCLPEAPPAEAVVKLVHADGSEDIVPRASSSSEGGWTLLDSGHCLGFSGAYLPRPGDRVEVHVPL
ncbi:MAG: hypothetical protein ABIJ09_04590 [Pseudomonadota bacterium]